jgi:hypothetical protein
MQASTFPDAITFPSRAYFAQNQLPPEDKVSTAQNLITLILSTEWEMSISVVNRVVVNQMDKEMGKLPLGGLLLNASERFPLQEAHPLSLFLQ